MEKEIIKNLDRLTYLMCGAFGWDYNHVRGFSNRHKGWASYLASRILGYDDAIISCYYRIGVDTMRLKWQDIAIERLVEDRLEKMEGALGMVYGNITRFNEVTSEYFNQQKQ